MVFCCCSDRDVVNLEELWESLYHSKNLVENLGIFLSRLESMSPYDLMPEWEWLYDTGRVSRRYSDLNIQALEWYSLPNNRDKKKKALDFFSVLHREGKMLEFSERSYLL